MPLTEPEVALSVTTPSTPAAFDPAALLAAGAIPMPHASQLAAAYGLDPSTAVYVPCEAPECGQLVQLAQAYSLLALTYAMPGYGKAGYHCRQEQHFGCSHAHARAALLRCLDEHIESGDHA